MLFLLFRTDGLSHTLQGTKIASLGWHVPHDCYVFIHNASSCGLHSVFKERKIPAAAFSFPGHSTNRGLHSFTTGGGVDRATVLSLEMPAPPLPPNASVTWVPKAPASLLPTNPSGSHSLCTEVWG